MSFLYPSFLLALLVLLIPIIIHLFNFRRYKKVYFSNVKFLREVKEEKANRSRLKHLLVLLSRMLALAFLVFAFAQPFIPKDDKAVSKGDRAVSVYVDNSFSMDATAQDVSLIEKAKQKAQEILDAYGPEVRFQLVTNNFEGKFQRLLDKDEFLGYLEEVATTPNVHSLSSVTQRMKQVLDDSDAENKNIFLLSDFQESIVDLEMDTSYNWFVVPIQGEDQQNVYIDTAWFESPVQMLNTSNQLIFRVNNAGTNDVSGARLTLKLNDQTKALKDFDLKAGASIVDTINFSVIDAGWNKAELVITDYPVSFDDSYYLTFKIDEEIKILGINQSSENRFLRALYDASDKFKFVNQKASQLDFSKIDENRVVILNGLTQMSSGLGDELRRYLTQGGNVLIFPAMNMQPEGYNNFLRSVRANTYGELVDKTRETDLINTSQEVFKDVFRRLPRNLDLPKAKKSFELTRFSGTTEQQLLRFRDGGSMVSKYAVGRGKLYLAATSLEIEHSNLPSHGVFVPMIYEIAFVGGEVSQLAYTIGDDDQIQVSDIGRAVDNSEAIMKMKGDEGEFIPGQKVIGSQAFLTINNQLKEDGFYQLFRNTDDALAWFGFNFNRKESQLTNLSIEELKSRFTGEKVSFIDNVNTKLDQTVGELERGTVLWKWCIILTLIFLAIEILLLRFWKD